MLPSFTYRRKPGMLARGSTTTTFDGVGVRIGPFGWSGPPPGSDGRPPPSRAKLTSATTTSPTIDSAGATSNGSRRPPTARGARGLGLARVIAARRRQGDRRARPGRLRRGVEDRPGLGVVARRRRVADLELERFDAAEPAAAQLGHDVDHVALGDLARQLRPAEGDAVEDVEPALERQLGVPATRLAHLGHRQPEDREQRLRVPRAPRLAPPEVAMQAV